MYNKALIICPKKYTFTNIFGETLKPFTSEISSIDSNLFISKSFRKIHSQLYRFPFAIRNKLTERFLKMVNDGIYQKFLEEKPDIVWVYNSEYLLPETCIKIKKHAKLIFFLGDSPFFTPQNNYFLADLGLADLILAPDSFWVEQLKVLGYQNVHFFVPSPIFEEYKVLDKNQLEQFNSIKETEILYSGLCYVNSWGYKKALFMSKFTDFDFKLYGSKHWKKWFSFFPELNNHFIQSDFIPTNLLNVMYNKTKIVPVDGNPGILNGFHIRAFEALAAGAFPLIEYRKDIVNEVFAESGIDMPVVTDYGKAKDIALYFLSHETERKEIVNSAWNHISKRYSIIENSSRILDYLSKK